MLPYLRFSFRILWRWYFLCPHLIIRHQWHYVLPMSICLFVYIPLRKSFSIYTQGQGPWKKDQVCLRLYHIFELGACLFFLGSGAIPCPMDTLFQFFKLFFNHYLSLPCTLSLCIVIVYAIKCLKLCLIRISR